MFCSLTTPSDLFVNHGSGKSEDGILVQLILHPKIYLRSTNTCPPCEVLWLLKSWKKMPLHQGRQLLQMLGFTISLTNGDPVSGSLQHTPGLSWSSCQDSAERVYFSRVKYFNMRASSRWFQWLEWIQHISVMGQWKQQRQFQLKV